MAKHLIATAPADPQKAPPLREVEHLPANPRPGTIIQDPATSVAAWWSVDRGQWVGAGDLAEACRRARGELQAEQQRRVAARGPALPGVRLSAEAIRDFTELQGRRIRTAEEAERELMRHVQAAHETDCFLHQWRMSAPLRYYFTLEPRGNEITRVWAGNRR